jgi:hypothetical protein
MSLLADAWTLARKDLLVELRALLAQTATSGRSAAVERT